MSNPRVYIAVQDEEGQLTIEGPLALWKRYIAEEERMESEQTINVPQQSQSSIEITRYKDGTMGWVLKRYTGSEFPDLGDIYLYDDELKRRFVAPAEGRGAP